MKTENPFPAFISNPWIGLVGLIIGLLGLGFALYSWYDAKAYRQFEYYVDPARAIVVQSGKTSSLTVNFKNETITSDITAVQVAVWNSGKLPIRSTDILERIVVRTSGAQPILEATIRSASRDVTGITIDTSELAKGRLPVNWKILEKNDGCVIQLIYSGATSVQIVTDGVIEGQTSLMQASKVLEMSSTFKLFVTIFGVQMLVTLAWQFFGGNSSLRESKLRMLVFLLLALLTIGFNVSFWWLIFNSSSIPFPMQ